MIAGILLAAALVFGLASGALAQPRSTYQYKLRNVSAADAAEEIVMFAVQKSLAVDVLVEPVSNAVAISAELSVYKQVGAMLAGFDVQPPQVLVRLTLARVPVGFAEDAGLGTKSNWVLTDDGNVGRGDRPWERRRSIR